MIEFEILKEVTLAINQDREKKKAEKLKGWGRPRAKPG